MKKLIAGFALSSIVALAETWTGTVVDVMCKNNELAMPYRAMRPQFAPKRYGHMPSVWILKFVVLAHHIHNGSSPGFGQATMDDKAKLQSVFS